MVNLILRYNRDRDLYEVINADTGYVSFRHPDIHVARDFIQDDQKLSWYNFNTKYNLKMLDQGYEWTLKVQTRPDTIPDTYGTW